MLEYGEKELALSMENTASKNIILYQSYFRDLVEHLPVGIYVVVDGVFRYVNPAFAAIFGYEPDEIVNRLTPVDLARDEYKEIIGIRLARRIRGEKEPVFYQVEGIRKDGETVTCLLIGSAGYYHGKPAAIGALVNITEQKEKEEAIKRRGLILEAIAESTEILLKERNPENIIPSLLNKFSTATGASNSCLIKFSPDSGEVSFSFHYCAHNCKYCASCYFGSEKSFIPPPANLLTALQEGKSFIFPSPSSSPAEKSAFFPIVVEDRPWGALCIGGLKWEETELTATVRSLTNLIAAIMEKQKQENQRRETEELLEAFFNNSLDACFFMTLPPGQEVPWHDGIDKEKMLDFILENMRIIRVNQAAVTFYGAESPSDLIGLRPVDLGKVYRKDIRKQWMDFLNNGRMYMEGRERKLNGQLMWVEGSAVVIYGRKGHIRGLFAVKRDVTSRKEMQDRLYYLSNHDSLTGLFNRAHFDEKIKEAENYPPPVAVIVLDIDNLKPVNDNYGHHTGDRLIQRAAAIIRSALRHSDFIARIGGDEFVIILPHTDRQEALKICERIRWALSEEEKRGEKPVLSISLGLGVKEYPEQRMSQVFKEADDNMYREKKKKKTSSPAL